MISAVEFTNVSKKYPHFQLRDVNLSLQSGMVHALVGPNGAGKSTLLRLLIGLIKADSGCVSVLGKDIGKETAIAKRYIGFMSEEISLQPAANLQQYAQLMRDVYTSWDDEYCQELLTRFGLNERQPIREFSHGQRIKSLVLLALAWRPQLLVLDEPTNGLDPVARHEVNTEIMRCVQDESRTVLLSSHNTQDLERVCDHITFIDRGVVIDSRDRDTYFDGWRRIRVRGELIPAVKEIPNLHFELSSRNQFVAVTSVFSREIEVQLESFGLEVERVEPLTLEEIFVATVMCNRQETTRC